MTGEIALSPFFVRASCDRTAPAPAAVIATPMPLFKSTRRVRLKLEEFIFCSLSASRRRARPCRARSREIDPVLRLRAFAHELARSLVEELPAHEPAHH